MKLSEGNPKKFVSVVQIHGEDRKSSKPSAQTQFNTPSYAVQISFGDKAETFCSTYISGPTW